MRPHANVDGICHDLHPRDEGKSSGGWEAHQKMVLIVPIELEFFRVFCGGIPLLYQHHFGKTLRISIPYELHVTGIFTHINGSNLWCQCRKIFPSHSVRLGFLILTPQSPFHLGFTCILRLPGSYTRILGREIVRERARKIQKERRPETPVPSVSFQWLFLVPLKGGR